MATATRTPASEQFGWRTFVALAPKHTLHSVDSERTEAATASTTSPCHAYQVLELIARQLLLNKKRSSRGILLRPYGKHNEKSARRRRKHCTLALVKRNQKFRPAANPLSGDTGRPKFNQLETVTTFTYKPSLVRIDARNFELSW